MNKVELEEIAREAGVEAFELIPDTPQGRDRFISQIASIVKKACSRVTENAEKEKAELRKDVERLRLRNEIFEAAYNRAYKGTYQSHNGHWDREGTGGVNCPECIRANEAREDCQKIIATGLENLSASAESEPDVSAGNVSTQRKQKPCADCGEMMYVGVDHWCRKEAVSTQKALPVEAPFEVRLNDDETIDEIVADNVHFHLEQMDNGHWWIGLTPKIDHENRLLINLGTKRNAEIRCVAESENGAIIAGFSPSVGRGLDSDNAKKQEDFGIKEAP